MDGTQAEHVRILRLRTTAYTRFPRGSPTSRYSSCQTYCRRGSRSGYLAGALKPGDTAAVVGAGPVGLAAIMTSRLYGPGRVIAIDPDTSRLERAREFGADMIIDNSSEDAVEKVMEATDGLGADVTIEAVGIPETFELCTELVRPGGRVANVGVHGAPATLHLETLWIKSITITTGLVDTSSTPTLLELVSEGRLDPTPFATHRFGSGRDHGRLRRVLRRRQDQRPQSGPLGLVAEPPQDSACSAASGVSSRPRL